MSQARLQISPLKPSSKKKESKLIKRVRSRLKMEERKATGNTDNAPRYKFNLKILILVLHRACSTYRQFKLSTVMKSADKFNDINMGYKEDGQTNAALIQLKHQTLKKSCFTSLELNDLKEAFSLLEYFNCFSKIKLDFSINQLDEKELDGIIEKEIGPEFCILNSREISIKLHQYVHQWTSHRKIKMDFVEAFFNDLKRQITLVGIAGVIFNNQEKRLAFGDFFNSTEKMEKIIHKFTYGHLLMHLVHLKSKSPALTMIKIVQSLKNNDNCLVLNFETLLAFENQVNATLRARINFQIYVECTQIKKYGLIRVKHVLSELLVSAMESKGKTVIIFVSRDNDELMDSLTAQYHFEPISDCSNYNELTPEAKARILDYEVNFQGCTMKAKEIVDGKSTGLFDEEIVNEIVENGKISVEKPTLTLQAEGFFEILDKLNVPLRSKVLKAIDYVPLFKAVFLEMDWKTFGNLRDIYEMEHGCLKKMFSKVEFKYFVEFCEFFINRKCITNITCEGTERLDFLLSYTLNELMNSDCEISNHEDYFSIEFLDKFPLANRGYPWSIWFYLLCVAICQIKSKPIPRCISIYLKGYAQVNYMDEIRNIIKKGKANESLIWFLMASDEQQKEIFKDSLMIDHFADVLNKKDFEPLAYLSKHMETEISSLSSFWNRISSAIENEEVHYLSRVTQFLSNDTKKSIWERTDYSKIYQDAVENGDKKLKFQLDKLFHLKLGTYSNTDEMNKMYDQLEN